MYADEGQWGSNLPVYQVLMEWKLKKGTKNDLDKILQNIDPDLLTQTASWGSNQSGAVLFDAIELGTRLDEYYTAVRVLRDMHDLDAVCEARFTIGKKVFTDIWFKVQNGTDLEMGVEDWSVNHNGKPDQVTVFKWRSDPGNSALAGTVHDLGRKILEAAKAEGFELISYNLTSFSSEWDGWRVFQARGKGGTEFRNNVLKQLGQGLTYDISDGALDRVKHTKPQKEGSARFGSTTEGFKPGSNPNKLEWKKAVGSVTAWPVFACRRQVGPQKDIRGASIPKKSPWIP